MTSAKLIKNILFLMLILTTIFSPLVANAATVEVDSTTKEPQIYIENADLPEVTIGEEFDLELVLLNNSIYTAKEIKVAPQLTNTPFESSELMTIKELTSIVANKTENVSFRFRVNENTEPGIYPLTFSFEYRNMYKVYFGRSGDKQRTIYLKVVDAPDLPQVELSTMTVSPQTAKAGEFVDVTLSMINKGAQNAHNVELTLAGLSENGFSIYNDVNRRHIAELAGGESINFSYRLKVDEDMETGGHSLSYTVNFEDKFARDYENKEDIYIAVLAKDEEEEEDDSKTVPKLIVSAYGTTPSIVRAGGNFDLGISFLNTSSVKTVRNIKVSLSVNEESSETGNIFAPVNSSNTLFVDEIAPKESVSRKVPFYAVMDAKPKTYNVIVHFEYEDKSGNQYTAQEEIGIRVIQQPRLEVSEPSMQTDTMVGRSVPLMTEFYNMGRTTIYNLMVKVEGNFDIQTPNYFVGNFNSGSSDYFDTNITPLQEGQTTGTIIYQYEDAAGDQQEIRQEFTINAMAMPVMGPDEGKPGYEPPMPTEPTTKPFWKQPLLWGGIVAIIALIWWLRRRRKKKNAAIEHELLKDLTLNE